MRITNKMTTNNLLLNLNKNTENLNKLQTQIATGQKIQSASEDPIVATFALKFRTNVAETKQYMKNAEQAKSRMEITETALANTDNILKNLYELCTQGASDEKHTDRKAIIDQISEISKQLISEANSAYSDNYVFGGYKTGEKVIFDTNLDKLKYEDITQSFGADNINTITAVVDSGDPSKLGKNTIDVQSINLPYKNITDNTITVDANGTVTNATSKNSTDPDAHKVADNEIVYLKDTGELLLGKDIVTSLKTAGNFKVTYDKEGFQAGDLNPQQYFDCTQVADKDGNAVNNVFKKTDEQISYEFGKDNKMTVNVNGSDIFTAELISDLNTLIASISNMTPMTDEQIKEQLKINMGTTDYEALSEKELAEKVQKVKDDEQKVFMKSMGNRFSQAIGKLQNHSEKVSISHSTLGSRLNRLELISSRLEDDYTNYSELMTKNEGVDFEEAYLNYMTQQTVYNSALTVGSKIIQQSLVNFI